MKPSELLKKAKAKIEQGWCQHYSAMTKELLPAPPSCDVAVKWCSLGAINAVAQSWEEELFARRYLNGVVPGGAIAVFNDNPFTTKKDVIAKFDEAIKFAEKGGD